MLIPNDDVRLGLVRYRWLVEDLEDNSGSLHVQYSTNLSAGRSNITCAVYATSPITVDRFRLACAVDASRNEEKDSTVLYGASGDPTILEIHNYHWPLVSIAVQGTSPAHCPFKEATQHFDVPHKCRQDDQHRLRLM